MSDKTIRFSDALDRVAEKADKAGIAIAGSRIETLDDSLCLPYTLNKVGHLARWIVSLEHVDTPKGRRLFLLHQVPAGVDGMQWIGSPLDMQPPTQRLLTESELREVGALLETIYRRK